jgi:hypothetical protein
MAVKRTGDCHFLSKWRGSGLDDWINIRERAKEQIEAFVLCKFCKENKKR